MATLDGGAVYLLLLLAVLNCDCVRCGDCSIRQHWALNNMMDAVPDEYSIMKEQCDVKPIPGLEFTSPRLEHIGTLSCSERVCIGPGKIGCEIRSLAFMKLSISWTAPCSGESGVIAAHLAGVKANADFAVKTGDNFTSITLLGLYNTRLDRISFTMDGFGFFPQVIGTVLGKDLEDRLKPWLVGLLATVLKEIIAEASSNFKTPV